MFVCCECCVLSGRGLCDELITSPEESYRLWCVVVCDLETSRMGRPRPELGRSATKKKCFFGSFVYSCGLIFAVRGFVSDAWVPVTPVVALFHVLACATVMRLGHDKDRGLFPGQNELVFSSQRAHPASCMTGTRNSFLEVRP